MIGVEGPDYRESPVEGLHVIGTAGELDRR
jgi:hypothetical protein